MCALSIRAKISFLGWHWTA